MANKSRSYAEEINSTKVMLAGLNAQAERMAKRGIDAEFISKLQTVNRLKARPAIWKGSETWGRISSG